jgi:hypothetical protein
MPLDCCDPLGQRPVAEVRAGDLEDRQVELLAEFVRLLSTVHPGARAHESQGVMGLRRGVR